MLQRFGGYENDYRFKSSSRKTKLNKKKAIAFKQRYINITSLSVVKTTRGTILKRIWLVKSKELPYNDLYQVEVHPLIFQTAELQLCGYLFSKPEEAGEAA